MKTLIRTITICIAVNLMTAGFARAQNAPSMPPAAPDAEQIAEAELAVKEARMQKDKETADTEVLMKQLKDLQKLKDLEFTVPVPTPHIAISSSGNFHHMGSDNSALIIPNTQMNTEDIVGINQDLNVMSQIFNQKLDRENLSPRNRMFTGVWSYGGLIGSSTQQSMYLQGYGVIFMMNVDFPLSPLPKAEQEQEQTEEDEDPVWEETRKQIYEPQDARRKRKRERPEIEYDAEKVEDLKEALIESLKHAANIRVLTPDESVILTVTGNSEQFGTMTTITVKGNKTNTVMTPGSAEAGQTATAKLVIRAKKSDIDAFANANTNLEQFREKVQIISCPYVVSHAGNSPTLPSSVRGRSSGYGDKYR